MNIPQPNQPSTNRRQRFLLVVILCCMLNASPLPAADLLTIDNGSVKVGIDREKGGAITWLSSDAYPHNTVNIADPGRLIQQSYYAGRSLDRTSAGQSKAWSPWPWNPIQGGGVGGLGSNGTWARVTAFEKKRMHCTRKPSRNSGTCPTKRRRP